MVSPESQRRWRRKQKPEFFAARAESDALAVELCGLMERKTLVDALIRLYDTKQ